MKACSQRGFTLIEVLSATTAVMVISIPALAMLFQAFEWYDDVQSRLALNRQAREVMYVLADGAKMSSNGTDATANIYGLHARNVAPAGPLRSSYKFQYTSNGLTVTGSELGTMSITCTGVARPLPDCTTTETKTVQGWVGSDVTLNSTTRSVSGRTTEISVVLTDPYEAQRLENPAHATERYRIILARHRDNTDP
jgi:hypothetical protein